MSKVRSVVLALLIGLALTACETWDRVDSRSVPGKIVSKYTRKPSKMSRRYYVVVEYEGRQVRIRDRQAYREKNIGDPYTLCLNTYVERERKETRTELEKCPIHTQ